MSLLKLSGGETFFEAPPNRRETEGNVSVRITKVFFSRDHVEGTPNVVADSRAMTTHASIELNAEARRSDFFSRPHAADGHVPVCSPPPASPRNVESSPVGREPV